MYKLPIFPYKRTNNVKYVINNLNPITQYPTEKSQEQGLHDYIRWLSELLDQVTTRIYFLNILQPIIQDGQNQFLGLTCVLILRRSNHNSLLNELWLDVLSFERSKPQRQQTFYYPPQIGI